MLMSNKKPVLSHRPSKMLATPFHQVPLKKISIRYNNGVSYVTDSYGNIVKLHKKMEVRAVPNQCRQDSLNAWSGYLDAIHH
jgi:hypothetical protein